MKYLFTILATVVLLGACGGGKKEPETPYRDGAIVVEVKGMHCPNCEATVTTALSNIEGIEWARAENELDEVAYTGTASREVVAAAIREAGYEVP